MLISREKLAQVCAGRVNQAVRRGDIPKPTTLICVDCGAPATEYDHRDYRQPLAVEPVCKVCNCRRPKADPHESVVEINWDDPPKRKKTVHANVNVFSDVVHKFMLDDDQSGFYGSGREVWVSLCGLKKNSVMRGSTGGTRSMCKKCFPPKRAKRRRAAQ